LEYQSWLLLLHQIPPSPAYFRAKVLRRLNQIGALAIKNSAYLLPDTDETREDLQWVRSEICQEGGEAWMFRAEALAGLSSESLAQSFRELRADDVKQLLDSSNDLLQSVRSGNSPVSDLRKLKRRFEEVRRIDFFEAPGRKELEAVMETIETTMQGSTKQPSAKPDLKDLAGRTWVTRQGVKVDRIATAWLIRRFVDPAATFRFVDQDRYQHQAGEIRFDMFEGEFTHEGDLCTFEALLHYVGRRDPALDALAEIIHDIDLKDEKYQRPETAGIAAMISGIAALQPADERRIEEGARLFEATYAAVGQGQALST
jgi:hypothetical protein